MQLNDSSIYQIYTFLNRTNSTRYLTEILSKLVTVTENLSSIIKTHNNFNNEKITPRDQCNCKNKNNCPLDVNCQTSDIIYKCIPSTTLNPDKIYPGTAEGNFKKRYYNHKTSFKNREKANDSTLSKYVWEVKDKYKETPFLKWSIVKSVSVYSTVTKKCLLCLHEKLKINYPNQEELLNKRSELIMKCCHVNKYLLSNCKNNNQLINKIPSEHQQFVIKFKIVRYGNVSHITIFSVK